MSILPIRLGQQKILALRVLCLVLFAGLFVGVGYLHVVLSVGPNPYLSYQGRLADQNGNLLTGNYYITFCIYASSSPATACTPPTTPSQGAIGVLSGSVLNSALWGDVEYFSATNTPDNHVVNGVFNAKLGSQSSFPATLFNANSQLWLGVNIYNGSSWDGQMSPLQEIVSSGYAINAGMLSGFSASQTPGANNVVVLDGSGNLTINTGTKNIFGASAASSSQYGLVDIGTGGFGGGAGNFSGSSSGTLLALNAPSGFAGDLFNAQLNGAVKFRVSPGGGIYDAGNNSTFGGAASASANNGVLNIGSGGFNGGGGGNFAGSSSGTQLAINASSGFTGNLLDLQTNGSSVFKVDNLGEITSSGPTNVFTSAPATGGGTGVVNIGDGSFAGNFSGTLLGLSSDNNFCGNYIDIQQNGSSLLQMDCVGNYIFMRYGNLDLSGLSTPRGSAPTLGSSNAANLPGTYYVEYTWVNNNGDETKPSGEIGPLTVSGANTLTVTFPLPVPQAISYANIYVSNSGSGNEKLQGNVGSGSTTFTLTSYNNSGVTPPTVSTFNSDLLVNGDWNVFNGTPAKVTNGGVVNIGDSSNFSGSANGTYVALKGATGFTGNLIDAQMNGVSQWKLDNTGNMTLVGTNNLFSGAAASSSQHGVVNIGSGGFGGAGGNFSGSSSGTLLALNAPSGYAGDLDDLETNGVSEFKVSSTGFVTTNNAVTINNAAAGTYGLTVTSANAQISTLTAASTAPTLSVTNSGGSLAAGTWYGKYTWYNSAGETTPSSESTQVTTTGGASKITFTIPSIPSGATGAKLYLTPVNGASGTEVYQNVNITTGTSGVVSAYNAGSTPPSTNCAGGALVLANGAKITDQCSGYTQFSTPGTNSFDFQSTGSALFYNPTSSPGGGRLIIQPGSSNGLNRIYSSNGAQNAAQNLTITGNSSIPVLTLDAVSTVLTGNDNIFSSAANAGSGYGVVNIGSGGFGGAGGNFSGSSSGTELAINAPSGYSGNIADFQKNGTSLFKLDNAGDLVLATSAPATTQYPLVALGTGGFSGGNGGFNGWGNGIYIGVNAASGFGGNFLDFQIAGQSNFALDSTGAIYEGGTQHSYNNINLDQITAPSIASTSCTAGGALVATTYYIKVTAVNSTGESSVSSESSQACGANTVLNVALGEFVRGETSANIYVSNTAGGGSGAETKQANFTTSQGTWVEPTSGLVAGAAMPSSNSTGGGIHFGTGSMGWLGDDKNGYTEFGVGSNTGLFSTSSTSGFLFYNTTGSPGGGRLFIQPGTSNGLNEIYSTNGAQSGVQNLTISGPSSIPVLTLDAVSTVFTGNDNIFQSAANAGANYGVVNIGSGGFSGGAGKFAGSTSGTLLALNAPNGYGGNLIDAQTNGSSVFKVDASGNLTVTGNIHSTATTYADVSSSGNQSIIFGSTGTFSQIPTMSVNLTCPANNTVVLALFNYNTFTSEPGVVAYALYRDGSRVQIASTNNISDPQSGPPVIIDPACPSGAHTYAMYAEILNTTGTITWNGPMQFQVKVLF